MKNKYKIIEESTNPNLSKIEKTSTHRVSFTLDEVEKHEAYLRKAEKELDAQVKFEQAKKQNIEEHHDFVLTMSSKDLATSKLYFDTNEMIEKCNSKLDEVRQALEAYKEEKEEINKQING